jgi:hypothetical protein
LKSFGCGSRCPLFRDGSKRPFPGRVFEQSPSSTRPGKTNEAPEDRSGVQPM